MHINRYTQPQTLTIPNNFKFQLPHSAKQPAHPEAYHLSKARESASTQQLGRGSGDMTRYVEINEAGNSVFFR